MCFILILFSRSKRAAPSTFTKYLEVLVVADTSVVEFIGKDKVKTYIMGLMNIVSTIIIRKRNSTVELDSFFEQVFLHLVFFQLCIPNPCY